MATGLDDTANKQPKDYHEKCVKTGKIIYHSRGDAEVAIGEINHKEKAAVSDFYLNSYQCTGYLNCGGWHMGRKRKPADMALVDAIRVIRAHPTTEFLEIDPPRAGRQRRRHQARKTKYRPSRERGQQSPE